MPESQYHHGNLRAALLDAAERTLREQGIDQVTLRALARQVGVSHGAPSRHFEDRQALLDALAESGYTRLGDAADAAVETAGKDIAARLRALAEAYVRFAIEDPALLELMFATRKTDPDRPGPKAPERPYVLLGELIESGQEAGTLLPLDRERLRLTILAMVQGIATLVTSGRVPAGQVDQLIADAVTLVVRP